MVMTEQRINMIPELKMPEAPKIPCDGVLYFLSGHYLFSYPENGGTHSKFVTAADVSAAFNHQEVDTGWLPAGVVRCGSNAQGPFYVYSAPAQLVEVTLNERKIKVPIPRTVLLAAGAGKFRLWAMSAKYFDAGVEAFLAPFPNVYESGEICWGPNDPGPVNPMKARWTWELFFATPFSDHLVNGKSRRFQQDVRSLQAALVADNARAYPNNDLVFAGNKIGNLIDQILEG